MRIKAKLIDFNGSVWAEGVLELAAHDFPIPVDLRALFDGTEYVMQLPTAHPNWMLRLGDG